MAVAVVDEITGLRQRIEEAATRPEASSAERVALLRSYRDDVLDLLGQIDSYLGDEALVEAALGDEANLRILRARANANLREELLRRGLATEEKLVEAGYLSHAELDRLQDEGLLEATLETLPLDGVRLSEVSLGQMTHFVGRTGKTITFDPRLHKRDRSGRFAEMLGALKSGDRLRTPDGQEVHRTSKGFVVSGGGGEDGTTTLNRPQIAARHVLNASARSLHAESLGGSKQYSGLRHYEHDVEGKREGSGGHTVTRTGDAAAAASDAAARGEPPERVPDETGPEQFARRTDELNRRVEERVAAGMADPQHSRAELHFNEAGHVSQRGLARYVDMAASKPTTTQMYARTNPDGSRTYDASRRELHERIVSAFLKRRKWNPEAKGGKGAWELDYNPDAEDLPSQDNPEVLFSGGGYAAGKGSTLKVLAARGEVPPDSFTLDPDVVKAQLPEYEEGLKANDPEANMRVYQEAWDIAQEIQARAQERKLNLIVDGISNTSPDEMLARWNSFQSRGYKGRAVYVDIPTEEAMKRAASRARNAQDDSDKRMIPAVIMRAVHRDVAATVPNMARQVAEKNLGLDVQVWDNNQGKDESGNFRPPKLFYSVDGGKETIHDQALWDRFRAKAHEHIANVD